MGGEKFINFVKEGLTLMIEGLAWSGTDDLSFYSPWESEASLPQEQPQSDENIETGLPTTEFPGPASQLFNRLEELELSEHEPEEVGLGFQVDQLA